jgi:hypothetical protein
MAIIRVPLVIRNGKLEELEQGEKLPNCTETLKFTFLVPAAEWLIPHSLDKHPAVSIVDLDGNVVHGEVLYVDSNNILVRFGRPFSGAAYIN